MEAMSPIYRRMAQVTGTVLWYHLKDDAYTSSGHSKLVQQKLLLKDAMGRMEPFKQMVPKVKEIYEATLGDQEKVFMRELSKVFDRVLQDYDMMFVIEELPDKGRDTLKEEVKAFVDQANKQYYGSMTEDFAKSTGGSE